MSILAIAVTNIICDGLQGLSCPDLATVTYHHPQSVAIRLARKEGWDVDLDVACPRCTKSGAASPATAPLPAVNRCAVV